MAQYFHADFTVPKGVHPFMSEIAHLTSHRGISQGSLAKSYNEIAGTNIDSPNVQRHFHTRRLSRKVLETYAKIFELSGTYVALLLALDGGKSPIRPPVPGTFGFHLGNRAVLDDYLGADAIRRVFKGEAFDHALELILADQALALLCLNEAALAWERHRNFGLLVGSELRPRRVGIRDAYGGGDFEEWEFDRDVAGDPWRGTGISEEAIVKWLRVARVLKKERGFDLLSHAATKSRKRLAAEATILNVWYELHEKVNWSQWAAIRAQMEAAFESKNLPVREMIESLHGDISYIDWAENNDPARIEHDFEEYDRIREQELQERD